MYTRINFDINFTSKNLLDSNNLIISISTTYISPLLSKSKQDCSYQGEALNVPTAY